VADVAPEGRLEATFVRSPVAHARLLDVDLAAAREMPGVTGAWAAGDLDLEPMGFPQRTQARDEMVRPPLAADRVRFVGEPVAVVVADDRYAGEDATAAVRLELEPLPVVLDPAEAARDDAPRLFDGVTNVANVRDVGRSVDDVIDGAPVVVRARYVNERVVPCSIETHGIVAVPRDGGLQVWCSHQAPHRLHGVLTRALELAPEKVRVVAPDVGGAFGSKSQTFPEYLVVARLALDLGRPVRWIEDRVESFTATTHGRGQHQSVTLASDRDGRLLGLEVEIDADIGAYPHTGEQTVGMTTWVMSGCYRIPRVFARSRAVVTNKTPTASYRGAGRPEAAFAVERTMDLLARELSIDPAELRRKNFIPPDAFPYESPTGAVYDSGRYEQALDQALELADYRSLRDEQARRRSEGGKPLGIGISSYIERSGGGPGSTEHGTVEVHGDGRIIARSGTASQGQGHLTALAQVVASALEVPLERIDLRQGDTAEVAAGTGTFGSRSMQVGGGALHDAALQVLDRAGMHAAEMLGVSTEDISYADEAFRSPGGDAVSLQDVAGRAGGLRATADFGPPQAFPFGTHVAVVEIDPDTGRVEVLRLVEVDDCGVVVNPQLVRGQATGSTVQGLGQALYEKAGYTEQGAPSATSFFSYAIPNAAVVPGVVHGDSVTPNPNVPLGTKGAGEAGCIGTPPAVVNAVADAVDLARDDRLDMPLLPEKVWAAMTAVRARR
jgi:carbon-monoxide dehydrogenase large subunit